MNIMELARAVGQTGLLETARESLTIPVTAQLKQALDDELARMVAGNVVTLDAARDREFVINENTGRRYMWRAVDFQRLFRQIARSAGVQNTLQFRDLRRTATVQLAEIGCSANQIASIPSSDFQRLLHEGKIATVGVSDRFLQGFV